MAAWIGQRNSAEVIEAFERAQAAVAQVYDIRDIFADPQYRALDSVTRVPDPQLGTVRMQNVLFRLSEGAGSIRFAGRPLGADNLEVYGGELGLSAADMDMLKSKGVI